METEVSTGDVPSAVSDEAAGQIPDVVGTENPTGQEVETETSYNEVQKGGESSAKELELAEKFNEVTSREKALRDNEESSRTSASELEAANEILAKFKENPLEGLRALGIDFKDVANLVINDEQPTADMQVKQLREEIAAERKATEEAATSTAERKAKEQQEYEAAQQKEAIAKAHSELEQVIESEPGKYEMIKTQNATDIVWDVATAIYQKTKQVPDWDKVCDQVEAQLTKEVEKYLATDKFKGKYQPVPEVVSHDDERDLEANYYGKQMIEEKYGRSLNNQMASETGAPKPADHNDYRTDEESKQYLADKLRKMMEA